MRKFILLSVLLLAYSMRLLAIPAFNKTVSVGQKDGTTLHVVICGDERWHFMMTLDSIPVFETQQGYCYGFIENDTLAVSDVMAHDARQRDEQERPYVSDRHKVREFLLQKRMERLEQTLNAQDAAKAQALGVRKSYVGSKKGLVILVNFANLSMSYADAYGKFNSLFNQVGYSENGSVGSVHDYFYDQSYGKFNLTFDVAGPVTVSRNYGYYGGNSPLYGTDYMAYEMVVEACRLVDSQVNFADYDWDGDGEVDQVFLIYAGYGESQGAPSNTIWPHESYLDGRNVSLVLDGVKINTYACSSELTGNSGNVLTGIGTPCHEFSHCLGLPDFYDTDYSGAFGMGPWSLMNSGSYSGPKRNGEVPYGYSAYERWFAGWLEPIELTGTQHIEALPDLGVVPKAYIIYNEGNRNEYYILENHQPSKWYQYVDVYRDVHGMLITHVNYDLKAWMTNKVNPTPALQRMTVIPADNSYGSNEMEYRGDLYPGIKSVVKVTDDSHINAGGTLYNPNIDGTYNMNITIDNILENVDGSVAFDAIFRNSIPAPKALHATNLNSQGYTANWEMVPEADYYIVEQTSMEIDNASRPVIKNQTIEYVYGTSQRMEWLSANGTTIYHVKAVSNGIASSWSETIEVGMPTGVIETVTGSTGHSIQYYGINGQIRLQPQKGLTIIKDGSVIRKMLMR